jgi:hypothetical protein
VKRSHYWIIALVMLVAVVAAPAILASAPTGAGPNDPLMVPTSSQTIAPNSTVWFYFDYVPSSSSSGQFRGGRFGTPPRANVALDANGVSGIQFAIFTPEQATRWMSDPTTTPVGRGTPFYDTSSDLLVHDLYWSGGFDIQGRYFIVVTNTSSQAVPFQLTVTGETVSLYPAPAPVASPTLFVPITVTPVPTATLQGKFVFETATGGAIYTVNGDGSSLMMVSHGIDPSWSPEGKQITFARWDNAAPGLYIANADGSHEQILYTSPRLRSPRFSPNGKYIAFTQEKSTNSNEPVWKLGVIEVATGKLYEPQCSRQCYVPSWGADSLTVAYFDPNFGIMATNILSGPAWTVMGPSGSYFDTTANITRPILNMEPIQSAEAGPDGKQFVYSQQAHDRWELHTVNADGSNSVGITQPDTILSLFFNVVDHNVAPTWSPDGKQVLFLSTRNGKWEFFVVNKDGSGLTQVLKSVTDSLPLTYSYNYERMIDWTP